jgi:7-cyano-7-deazaguanine synthase in queuosine biosynthesis
MEKQQTILAMYSGGLDSLGMLYELLTGSDYTNYHIHVHHVHNINIEDRHKAEALAVQLALTELKDLGFVFSYSESQISSPMYGNYFLLNKDIVKIAFGMNKQDKNHFIEERIKRGSKILSAFTEVKKIYPVLGLSKEEIFDSLPLSLKDKFWSCRHPTYTETNINSCGVCTTCTSLKETKIWDFLYSPKQG